MFQSGNNIKYLEKVVFIASVGYSGSTLLDMLLGMQEDITALGEVALLSRYVNDNSNCTCGEPVNACPFWSKIESDLKSEYGEIFSLKSFELTPEKVKQTIFRKIPTLTDIALILGSDSFWKLSCRLSEHARIYRSASLNALKLFDLVCKNEQTKMVVDSTKYALPLKCLYMELKDKLKIIYLVRDGRAVCESLMKRQGLTMEQAVKKWVRFNQNLYLVTLSIPNHQIYNLTYEKLCLDTDNVFRELTEFLGTSDPVVSKPLLKENFHDIGGNPMRFRKNETEIKYNDDWKSSITSEELRIFEKHGGKMNGKLGYTNNIETKPGQ